MNHEFLSIASILLTKSNSETLVMAVQIKSHPQILLQFTLHLLCNLNNVIYLIRP